MRVAIIGGGISGLTAAFYLKQFALPISQITLFEASSRFGGWINSRKLDGIGKDKVIFETGPRTLRLSTCALKELNSLELAHNLQLAPEIEIINAKHPAALNRYIYFNNKLCRLPGLFQKSDLLPKRIVSYAIKEFTNPRRNSDIEDESLFSFISRRVHPDVANNIVDPLFKGVCGGNINYLSAAAMIPDLYKNEAMYGSILKGAFKKKVDSEDDKKYFSGLIDSKSFYKNQSVWRLKNGMNELVTKLVESLSKEDGVQLLMNEPVQEITFLNKKSQPTVSIKSKSINEEFDVVISAVLSKDLSKMIPDEHQGLKNDLNRIQCANMALVNFYFKKDVLPVKGFGYLVTTSQQSPILGCVFDSVFNRPDERFTVLTVMMGGAWYDEYIAGKDSNTIEQMALSQVKRHLNFNANPDLSQVTFLKDAIPQYKVGHGQILKNIQTGLVDASLNKTLYLTGNSYEGVGVNDSILMSRKLVQIKLSNDHFQNLVNK